MARRSLLLLLAAALLGITGGTALGGSLPLDAGSSPVFEPGDIVDVEGTEIVVRRAGGGTVRSRDLAGAVLPLTLGGRPAELRIDAVEVDPLDESRTVLLHTFEKRQADGTWANVCKPDPKGRRQGIALKGQDGTVDVTCVSGVIGKCVRFGYWPWAKTPSGRPMAPLHASCMRMMRGDYGGSDEPWTKNGMRIDVYDHDGVQEPNEATHWVFEAGWTPEGAVCVHHVRVGENITLAGLEARYPRLRGRTGDVCTEAFAGTLGAILFNSSLVSTTAQP